MALKSLFLIRHGHTEWHATGGVAGSSDIALSDDGREAVRQLSATLEKAVPAPQAWYCSPMLRTRQSSALLRECWQSGRAESGSDASLVTTLPEQTPDARLVELDFGDWEGLTWAEVHEQHGDIMKAWAEDWVNRAPPGGERFSEQADRCRDWLVDASEELAGIESAAAVVVCHGGTIRAIMCECLGWSLDRAMNFRIDPASLTHLQYSASDERWLARGINVRRLP